MMWTQGCRWHPYLRYGRYVRFRKHVPYRNRDVWGVELSRDTKYHANVLCIVGDERFNSSTTNFIVKNRCFDFKEPWASRVADFKWFWTCDKAVKAFTVRNQWGNVYDDGFSIWKSLEFLRPMGEGFRQVRDMVALIEVLPYLYI